MRFSRSVRPAPGDADGGLRSMSIDHGSLNDVSDTVPLSNNQESMGLMTATDAGGKKLGVFATAKEAMGAILTAARKSAR